MDDTKVSMDDTLSGELSINGAKKRAWLVKIPTFIHEEWSKCGSNVPLGKMSIRQEEGRTEVTLMQYCAFILTS